MNMKQIPTEWRPSKEVTDATYKININKNEANRNPKLTFVVDAAARQESWAVDFKNSLPEYVTLTKILLDMCEDAAKEVRRFDNMKKEQIVQFLLKNASEIDTTVYMQ